MRWLLDHIADGQERAERGELCLGTMDSWVLWNLTGGAVHATDLTNASRTQLLDLHTLALEPGAARHLRRAGGGARRDPAVERALTGAAWRCGRLPAGVPIAALIGDSHAALFGQAGFLPGTVKATYGTGSSLMTPTPGAGRLTARPLDHRGLGAEPRPRDLRARRQYLLHGRRGAVARRVAGPARPRGQASRSSPSGRPIQRGSIWCRPSPGWARPTGTTPRAA